MGDWNTETAEWYAEKYGEYETNKLGIDAISLKENMTIVDIGCGTGSALRHASKILENGELIGIDPVPRMVEIAKEQTAKDSAADRIIFLEGGAEKLPVESEVADCVLAFDSFDHWEDQVKGLNEVCRILKPEGTFVVVKDGGLPDGTKAKEAFMSLLNESGLKVVEEKEIEQGDISFSLWVINANN